MNDFEGKTVLITGASRGIGKAAALAFSKYKANVIAVSRTEEDLILLQKEAPSKIELWVEDVTKDSFYKRISNLKKIDICINNAGMNKPKFIEDVDDETLDMMLNLNIRSIYKTSQAVTNVMKKEPRGGMILNITSQMGHVGSPKRSVYCLTKHAIEGLTKALAVELAKYNIRVCSIAPTFADTPMTKPMFEDKEFREFVYSMIPLKKLVEVDDIVAGIIFLSSPSAKMITGTSLVIDGGWTAH
jgi:NAD(P)-dependent dehydrogenase (short-subunit alcohol dehydrogenase family)